MQNSDFRTRITSLSGSQTSPMVFGIQNCDFSTRIASLYWSQPSSAVFAFKTATLAPELLVSMDPSPHLWFLLAKERLLDQNYLSLWVPYFSFVLCMRNSVISTRITSFHGSHTSPVVLCMQNKVISIRITSLYGSQPSSVVFACKTVPFGSELQVSMSHRLRLLICECKTVNLDPE